MSFLLSCPSCGAREVTDFAFGGEVRSVPTNPEARELFRYIYFRHNVAGRQREWWYHRSGCRQWFIAERDTTTNEVFWTAMQGDVAEAVSAYTHRTQVDGGSAASA